MRNILAFSSIIGIIGILALVVAVASDGSDNYVLETENARLSSDRLNCTDDDASNLECIVFKKTVDDSGLNIPISEAPALFGLSTYAEAGGTNPRTGSLSEPHDPNRGVRWNEYARFQEWVGGRDLATNPEYPLNKNNTNTPATWENSRRDAINRVISNAASRPLRTDGKSRPLVLGLPLLMPSESTTFQQVANGAADDIYYKPIRKALLDEGLEDTIIRLGWEANCNCYEWGTSNPESNNGRNRAEGYKSAFRHVVNVLKDDSDGRQDDFEFVFDTISLGYIIKDNRTKSDAELLYPGNDVVDYVGMDIYNQGSNRNRQEVWNKNHLPRLDALAAFANSRDKPIVIPEWGLIAAAHNGGGDDPIFTRNMLLWINSQPVAWHQNWSRWIPLNGGPFKLYPLYCSLPVLNASRTDYTCSRQNPPQSVYPNSSAVFLETLQQIEDSL